MGLTPQQAKALAFIGHCLADRGVAPSYSEIGVAVGIRGRAGVSRLLHGLRKRGAIDFIPGHSRSIRLVGVIAGLGERSSEELRAIRDRCDVILKGRAS